MKAKEFWKSFTYHVKENQTELKALWYLKSKDYKGETQFTKKIKEIIALAIKEKKPLDEFVVKPEYYKIDLVEWEQKKNGKKETLFVENGIKGYNFQKYAWNLDIAVEHENNKNLWMDEVIKLAYVFCTLRIVIGYFPFIKNGKEQMQKNYLDAITDTIKTLKCGENMKHGEFLIIIGDVAKAGTEGFEELKYTPYLYNKKKKEFLKQDW